MVESLYMFLVDVSYGCAVVAVVAMQASYM